MGKAAKMFSAERKGRLGGGERLDSQEEMTLAPSDISRVIKVLVLSLFLLFFLEMLARISLKSVCVF